MPTEQKVRIVCISDTHGHAPGEGYVIPPGDILIHAGDLTNQGSLSEIRKATTWLSSLNFAATIVVAGNHDLSLDPQYGLEYETGWRVVPEDVAACRRLLLENPDFVYLQHSEAVVRVREKGVELRVFGSPYSPDSRGRQKWAFQYAPGDAEAVWAGVGRDTDILVTHTPPAGICDGSSHWEAGGCAALREKLREIRPLLHVCGHCHEGRGAAVVEWEGNGVQAWEDESAGSKKLSLVKLDGERRGGRTGVVNASIMARSHGRGAKTFHKAVVVDLSVACRDSSGANA
ncbi:hypothetical protein CERZMDRAFT_71221 [Cercospora zeae-maydis SCOH1-5]|uniref:Calcineurin-like phosphoesterase domain-containing protein n=1 Tax=Cercospora zeae-maydis SCOH1-5 TaxID=717836 RepID=A0A6A6F3C2_9PEZI|nr:hypothetical protein CERZMDRAFT_71221 [Cercospora zeae-maydis SCOH1-5]